MTYADTEQLRSRPIDRLAGPLRAFARHRTAGAALLLGATLLSLGWANSPWRSSYHALLETPLSLSLGQWTLAKPLLVWVNDALMSFFFFVVGLEIKREVVAGELATWQRAALPAFAALGGLLVPAALYVAVNHGTPSLRGWGIPMATDIAFALGILSLVGDRVPRGVRVFLTALAIVDDMGAVLVIATVYTQGLSLASLLAGFAILALAVTANRLHVRSAWVYFILGSLVWLAFLKSGVHATIAAILMAMTIPARTRLDGRSFIARVSARLDKLRADPPVDTRMNSHEQQRHLEALELDLEHASAPLQRLEEAMLGPVTFLVLPIFAFANAGVSWHGSLSTESAPLMGGIVLGLLVGKPLGICLASWVTIRLGWARLPERVSFGQVFAASVLAGVGFTMALFITSLAFEDPDAIHAAKLAILAASFVCAVLGYLALRRATRLSHPTAPHQAALP